MSSESTTRFSNRVEDYVKYRPGYPMAIINYLEDTFGLDTECLVTDIGAGTGISTFLFLAAEYHVIAVEPNAEMRNKCIELLGSHANLQVRNGSAEHTGLDSGIIDVIIAGQAFHWFDADKAKAEFKRI